MPTVRRLHLDAEHVLKTKIDPCHCSNRWIPTKQGSLCCTALHSQRPKVYSKLKSKPAGLQSPARFANPKGFNRKTTPATVLTWVNQLREVEIKEN